MGEEVEKNLDLCKDRKVLLTFNVKRDRKSVLVGESL
jgi:hypothetical protein